jgi:hypothetical protein
MPRYLVWTVPFSGESIHLKHPPQKKIILKCTDPDVQTVLPSVVRRTHLAAWRCRPNSQCATPSDTLCLHHSRKQQGMCGMFVSFAPCGLCWQLPWHTTCARIQCLIQHLQPTVNHMLATCVEVKLCGCDLHTMHGPCAVELGDQGGPVRIAVSCRLTGSSSAQCTGLWRH